MFIFVSRIPALLRVEGGGQDSKTNLKTSGQQLPHRGINPQKLYSAPQVMMATDR